MHYISILHKTLAINRHLNAGATQNLIKPNVYGSIVIMRMNRAVIPYKENIILN